MRKIPTLAIPLFVRTYPGVAGAEQASEVDVDEPPMSESAASEARVDEMNAGLAAMDSPRGTACQASCGMAYGLGCAAVALYCPAGSFFTLGAIAIPCTSAILAACGMGPAGLAACIGQCPP